MLSRSRALFGTAAPATIIMLGLVSVAGGNVGGALPQAAGTAIARTNEPLAAAFALQPVRRATDFRRTLANAPLLPSGVIRGPDTPLEQLLREGDRPLADNGLCPPDMASIDDLYCVDRYEASLLEILPDGSEAAFSPFLPVEGHSVRAVSEPGVYPQGYISELQAQEACALSGKRLCTPREWRQACMGPERHVWGYGADRERGRCNDAGRSPVVAVYGHEDLTQRAMWDWERMNNPVLNQISSTLAKTGAFGDCTNDYGVYDMVGNLHEWVADPHGTFQGGYYQDTVLNGDGCTYVTKAHATWYHDYSTGFRCCSDVAQ